MPAFLFPNNVWAMILDFMHDGRDISRGYGVCRKWRGFLLQEDDGEARWKRLCLSYNLPVAELSGARKKQAVTDNNDAPPTAPCTKRARKLAIMTLDNVDQMFQSVMEELVEVDLRREGDIQELLHLF